jgi:S-adenosylmethionine hydrolase
MSLVFTRPASGGFVNTSRHRLPTAGFYMPSCTLLTDFGLTDYYVAAVKGVLLSLAGDVPLIDISHDVAPGDIEEASFLLEAAVPSFPAGTVHLAVVDPGVGSERRLLVVSYEDQLIVSPDNGLATPFLDASQVWSAERSDLYSTIAGSTFHARDRFAPIAAFLLKGGKPQSLGPLIPDPVRLPSVSARREDLSLVGSVRHVDRYGNVITNIPSRWLDGNLDRALVGGLVVERYANYYSEIAVGENAVIPGSLGTLELSKRNGDLAAEAAVERGMSVEVFKKAPSTSS